MNKAIFLDRDGVINIDYGYVYKPANFVLIEGVIEALKIFTEMNYFIILITNQSGIGRHYFTKTDFLKLNSYMLNLFQKNSIEIKDIFYCPHHPADNCPCRKPKTKMIDDAVSQYNIDRKNSYLVGDSVSDIEAGNSAKLAKSFLVSSQYSANKKENEVFENLFEVAKKWSKIM